MQSTLRLKLDVSPAAMAGQRQILFLPEYPGHKFQNLVAFGPNYKTNDSSFWKHIKLLCLNHVLENSQRTESQLISEMINIEEEARAAYPEDVLNNLSGSEFLEMMALDGCLFLLLAFSILGAGAQLKFSKNDAVFGKGCLDDEMPKWLESIFFVGNQIPFIVLEKLMELPFFREIKTTNIKQPFELEKRALYMFLLVRQERHPLDLIHCLQLVVLGSKSAPVVSVEMDGDLKNFPSASQLFDFGISFRILEGESGCREINYKASAFTSVLNLPVLKVNRYTKLIFDCLRKYEIVQGASGIECVSSYFIFLAKLIRTPQDVAILSSQGVLQGHPESLLGFLNSFNECVAPELLHHLTAQIQENPPVLFIKPILILLVLLWEIWKYPTASFLTAKLKEHNDWLPMKASVNAKWWHSAFNIVAAMLVAVVLGLPYALAELGCGPGVTTMIISWIIILYILLGDIPLAFTGPVATLNHAKMCSSPEKHSKKSMWKVVVAYICAFLVYWSFWTGSDGIIPISLEKPSWLIALVNLFIVVHLIGSNQVFPMPFFDMIEAGLVRKMKLKPSRLFRIFARSMYVLLTVFLAISSPFFGGLLSCIGGLAFAPTIDCLPCTVWLTVYKPKRFSLSWITNWMCIILCVFLMILAPMAALRQIILQAKDCQFFL